MLPWITLAIAAVIGAAIGGGGGLIIGLVVGFVFNMILGTLFNRSQVKARQAAGALLLQQVGAPPPPYPLDPQDHVCIRRLAAMLPGSLVREVAGNYGPELELTVPVASPEPLVIVSRTWDPDRKRVGTLMMCAGNVTAPIIQVAAECQLEKMDATGPFTMFTRF